VVKAASWHQYPNEWKTSWAVPDGTATVYFDPFGVFVEQDDGTRSPREFTYVEGSHNPNRPGWIIECEYGDDFVPRVRSVHAVARIGGSEVRSVDLRRLRPLEDVIEEAWRKVSIRPATVVKVGDTVDARDLLIEEQEMIRTFRGLRLQARRRVTPKLLAEVAEIYREHADDGAPTRAVREHFGIAPSTASSYVKQAREAGHDLPRPAAQPEVD
jgi:hypothetical protein